MDIPYTYQYFPAVPLSDMSDLYSVGDLKLNNQKIFIISFLPKILRIGMELKTLVNRYILFIENTATVDSIAWTITFYNKGEALGNAGLVVVGDATNDFRISMNDNLFDGGTKKLLYDKLIVSCTVIKGAETQVLSIEHILISMFEFGNLLQVNDIKPGLCEKFFISNPLSTNYLFNCLNDYLTDPSLKWNKIDIIAGTPQEKENLQKIVASIMYYYIFHYGKTSGEDIIDILTFENLNIKTHLNSVPIINYDGGFRNGICYSPLYLLNDIFSDIKVVPDFNNISNNDKIYEILSDETLINSSKRPDLDDNVTDLVHIKIADSKQRLYGDKVKLREFFNLTLFPKSCIKLTAILIKYLFECSQKNLCNECIRKKDAWLNIGLDQIDEYDTFFKNIMTHFFLAPAGKITKLIKPARKTWKYFGSIYIDMIVNNKPRIVTAYFAKKVVNEINNELTCHFERIDDKQIRVDVNGVRLPIQPDFDSILGRQVFLIIETVNCRKKQIVCNVSPLTNVLTGNRNNLNLVIGPNTWNPDPVLTQDTDFTAVVGELVSLNDINGVRDHYINVHDDQVNSKYNIDHIDKAIIKINLRPFDRLTFDTWAINLTTQISNLKILGRLSDGSEMSFGNDPNRSTDAGEFLSSRDLYDDTARFRIKNQIVYEIFNRNSNYIYLSMNGLIRRKIGRIENSMINNIADGDAINFPFRKVIFYYHDLIDNEHFICDCQLYKPRRRANGIIITNNNSNVANVPAGFTSDAPAPAGGDAFWNYYYPNDDIVTRDNPAGAAPDYGIKRYPVASPNVNDLAEIVRMPDSLNISFLINNNTVQINYSFFNTQRRWANPGCFAAFIGVLAEANLAVESTGMCFEDATSFPSISHPNGDSIDTRYLVVQADEQTVLNAFLQWNFTQIIRGLAQNWLVGAHGANAQHNDHLHSGNFDINSVQIINL